MRNNPQEALPPDERSQELFKLMRDEVETPTTPKNVKKKVENIVHAKKSTPVVKNFRTGAGAMDEWQQKQEDIEDTRPHKAA